jgi:hypothetical protein
MTLEDAREYVWEHGKPLPTDPAAKCRVAFNLQREARLAEEFKQHAQALRAQESATGTFTVPLPL